MAFLLRLLLLVTVLTAASANWTTHFSAPFQNLVYGGQEGTDRYPTNVCRFRGSDGRYFPGKLIPDARKCYYASGGSERSVSSNFEVLEKPEVGQGAPFDYEWLRSDSVLLPDRKPVIAGVTSDGQNIYICRTLRVKIQKVFWTGYGVLVGHMVDGGSACRSPWNGGASLYSENDILYYTISNNGEEATK